MTEATLTVSPEVQAVLDADFGFEILKYELAAPLIRDAEVVNLATTCFGLFRSDNDDFVGGSSVSARYEPHTIEDVKALILACGELCPNGFHIQTVWNDGHVILVHPHEAQIANIGKFGSLRPLIVIKALYNKRAFQVIMGMYNFVCSNLMMLNGSSPQTHVSIRHTSGLPGKMNELIKNISRLDGAFDVIVENAFKMMSHEFSIESFVTAINGPKPETEGSKLTRWNAYLDEIKKIVWSERSALGIEADASRANGWELYNAVQGFAQHKQTRRNDPTDSQRVLLAADDPRVKKAEAIALSGSLE